MSTTKTSTVTPSTQSDTQSSKLKSAVYNDYVPSPMVPLSTRISFLCFALLYTSILYYYSLLIPNDIHSNTYTIFEWSWFILRIILIYPIIYLYMLDFISGISHGIFDNLPYLGPILSNIKMKDTFDIKKYCNYYNLENKINYKLKLWEILAWDHQRHHEELYLKHALRMSPGFHALLLIPIAIYILLIGYTKFINTTSLYDDRFFIYIWYINNWFYLLCYGFPLMYFIHAMAHARTHEPNLVPNILKILQDYHIILHPKTHMRHHKQTKRYYSIVNGWSHPLQNFVLDLVGH